MQVHSAQCIKNRIMTAALQLPHGTCVLADVELRALLKHLCIKPESTYASNQTCMQTGCAPPLLRCKTGMVPARPVPVHLPFSLGRVLSSLQPNV